MDPELAWMNELPEDMRKDPTLSRVKAKDVKDALAKVSASYVSTRRLVTEGSLPLPKTDDDRARIFDALGRPKTAGDYTHKVDEKTLPQGLTPNKEATERWSTLAHKIGLSDAQHSAIRQAYWEDLSGFVEGMRQVRQEEFDAGTAALQKSWGGAFETNKGIAQAAIAKLGGQEFANFLDVTGLGNHPMLLQFAYEAGQRTMSQDELAGATQAQGGMTTDQINQRMAELRVNPAYTTKGHPEHATVMAEMRKLQSYLTGGK